MRPFFAYPTIDTHAVRIKPSLRRLIVNRTKPTNKTNLVMSLKFRSEQVRQLAQN